MMFKMEIKEANQDIAKTWYLNHDHISMIKPHYESKKVEVNILGKDSLYFSFDSETQCNDFCKEIEILISAGGKYLRFPD